jgi:hypothetical protein
LNLDESIPINNVLILSNNIKDEIILSNIVQVILAANF